MALALAASEEQAEIDRAVRASLASGTTDPRQLAATQPSGMTWAQTVAAGNENPSPHLLRSQRVNHFSKGSTANAFRMDDGGDTEMM